MRLTDSLRALVFVFIGTIPVYAHPGHDPAVSPHHNLVLGFVAVALSAVIAGFLVMKTRNNIEKADADEP